LDLLRWIY